MTKAGALTYKGRPLVRSGNTIYYGDMGDKYVAMLQILAEAPFEGEQHPGQVALHLWPPDAEPRQPERAVKRSEKSNLYDALNIASIWLERQLSGK